ncbi:hypothetical protein Moror_7861 [Moniliophthora roreri MCA 2997]|uniref:Uncharacterized protein n=1 Tax=Moniliophthora roreri (strain MCA 2997) TaxID=1381753 RepID=V2WTA1_MONRO|nr:hypothetical protein Moror_7861 [Moniliophthora roreri MCA 2997]
MDSNPQALVQITCTAVQFLFCGIYIVSFGPCVHILSSRPGFSRSNLSFLATILLFILSSVDMAVYVTADVLGWCNSCHSRMQSIERLFYAGFYLKFASSAIADAILL